MNLANNRRQINYSIKNPKYCSFCHLIEFVSKMEFFHKEKNKAKILFIIKKVNPWSYYLMEKDASEDLSKL